MRRSVLIIVQNLPLPGDRRVWLECQALVAAGWQVSAITPKGNGDPDYELLSGVHLYKYAAPRTGTRVSDYLREFAYCWLQTARLSITAYRRHRFAVLQACNPPDTFWLLALLYRLVGVRFVFDQHDLCPEVYLSRGDRPSALLLAGTRALEQATYRTADHVIVTNESYRAAAEGRGRVDSARVTTVRTGPDAQRMRRGASDPALKRGREFLGVYIGVMGPQDGVDVLVRAVQHYVSVLGRQDCTFALLGQGDSWQDVRALVQELGLEPYVYLPGRVSDEELFRHLSTADVGLCPDLPNALNDVSTMNKTMEYMAFEVPVVAFDLKETRVSADDAALYVNPAEAEAFGAAVASLLDAPAERRLELGRRGRHRVETRLDWRHQAPNYLSVYQGLSERD